MLIGGFQRAQAEREEELRVVEEANFTEDEEDMGITPSDYNILNQRFTDQDEIKVYLAQEEEGSIGSLKSSSQKRGGMSNKIVPLDEGSEDKMHSRA